VGTMDTVTFNKFDDIKCLGANIYVENEGHILRVPVYLYNVRPFRELIIGVSFYIDNTFYAMKTKKIFTGGRYYCPNIREFYAGDFLFLFADDYDLNKKVHTRVLSHYIY